MPFYNFDKDLPIAKKTEREIAKILELIYGAKILKFENSNKYDILAQINEKNVTYEVKEDFICEKTNNVGVEFSCRGKPSGISISEADYYIYKLHTKEGIRIVEHLTSTLKRMIELGLYFRIVNGGDPGSDSLNYLFKYDIFVRNSKVLRVSPIPLDKTE